MNTARRERWSAASGYLVFALGIAGMAFERGAPPASAPAAEALAFFVRYRSELLAQSLVFVLSAGVYLWFFGEVRSYLARAERTPAGLSTVAFGAGVVWASLQMVMQSMQVALALSAGDLGPALAGAIGDMTYAVSVIAYVPLAVALAAVAAVSLPTGALPRWLGWYTLVFAVANLAMSLGIVVESGPLVPGGALTYVLYLMLPVWLLSVTTVMVVRAGRRGAGTSERTQGVSGPAALQA